MLRRAEKGEVETLIAVEQEQINAELKESLALIEQLKKENYMLSAKLSDYEQKEELIVKTLRDSEEKAREIENKGSSYVKSKLSL